LSLFLNFLSIYYLQFDILTIEKNFNNQHVVYTFTIGMENAYSFLYGGYSPQEIAYLSYSLYLSSLDGFVSTHHIASRKSNNFGGLFLTP